MIPLLIDKRYDLARFYEHGGRAVTTNDGRAMFVMADNPSVPEHNGKGYLPDAESCYVTQELNGLYELEMTYPMDGENYSSINIRDLIIAKPDRTSNPQPFRVYRITKPLDGRVKIYARHLVYDLAGIVIAPFSATGIRNALNGIKTNAMTANPFTISTTRTTESTFKVYHPISAWSLLGGSEGSLLDIYGGEYTFDGYNITLENSRGSNNGVSIKYGVNLTELEQDENYSDAYTGVVGYWEQEEDVVYGNIVKVGESRGYSKVLSVDFSQYFDMKPTPSELDALSEIYINANNVGLPDRNWEFNFVPLDSTEEYKDFAPIQSVSLGDTVTTEYEALGVDTTERVVKIVWDVLDNKYKSVSLGKVKSNIADTIASTKQKVDSTPSYTEVKSISKNITKTLTDAILGAIGGAVRLLDTDNDGMPDTLYIADSPNPENATKVWRFNYEGWAASENGYNGPFKMGATLNDGLLAEFVTAANLIAGNIRSNDGVTFNLNLDEGILQMGNYYTKNEANNQTEAAIGRFVRIQDGKIYIGMNGSNIQLVESNDKVAFVDIGTNTELAYISNNRFYMPNATVRETINIGGYCADGTNGLSWKWAGGN